MSPFHLVSAIATGQVFPYGVQNIGQVCLKRSTSEKGVHCLVTNPCGEREGGSTL